MPDGAAPPKRAAVKWHGRQLVAKEAQLELKAKAKTPVGKGSKGSKGGRYSEA